MQDDSYNTTYGCMYDTVLIPSLHKLTGGFPVLSL